MMTALARSGWLAWLLLAWMVACSTDERSNPQRIGEQECLQRNGKYIAGRYCVFPDAAADSGEVTDAGKDEDSGDDSDADTAKPNDSGVKDGDIPGKDSGGPEECSPNGKTEVCYTGADVKTASQLPCKAGTRSCADGFWGECEGEVVPGKETCNSKDDDCDGVTDESLAGARCEVQNNTIKGVCRDGVQICRDGAFDCIPMNGPSTDICNDKDDDCDGNVDEDTDVACYAGSSGCDADGSNCKGICEPGSKACVKGKYAATCSGGVTPATEQCSTSGQLSKDENCDGTVDEGCSCNNGDTFPCYSGTPVSTQNTLPCKAGTRTCSGGALSTTCAGEVVPTEESCANEGVDNDCNGTADDIASRGTSCSDASTGRGECKAQAKFACSGGNQVCQEAAAGTETCNTKDDDCDGNVDENWNLQTDVNNCGSCGHVCPGSAPTCCGGNCVNTTSSNNNCGACGMTCAANWGCCTGSCKNLVSDNNNCGTCKKMCGVLIGGLLGSCVNRNCQ